MGRLTGPVCRICRRVGDKLFLKGDKCSTKCTLESRRVPPGEHAYKRRKLSERGIRLREKQKARIFYGLSERQFRGVFEKARQKTGVTGDLFFQLLETRLDNVIFRLGFAASRRLARELVRHGHFTVNGKPVNIPSFRVKVGDGIAWREGSTKLDYYKALARQIQGKVIPAWLNLDLQTLSGKVAALPQRSDMDVRFDERLIVEYYSR